MPACLPASLRYFVLTVDWLDRHFDSGTGRHELKTLSASTSQVLKAQWLRQKSAMLIVDVFAQRMQSDIDEKNEVEYDGEAALSQATQRSFEEIIAEMQP